MAVASALLHTTPLRAQQASSGFAAFSNVYLTAGTLLMDVSKLNPHLERNDLPLDKRPGYFTVSNDAYAIGLGGYGILNGRWALGGEFIQADVGEESSPSGKTDALTTTYWMGTLGYAAFTTWRLNVIPFVGVGRGSATLSLRNRGGGPTVPDGVDPTFDEVVESPGAESKLVGSYALVEPGVAVDFLAVRSETSTYSVSVGLRFGTVLSPNRTTWTYRGREVFGGPDMGPTGGYMRVTLGIGGFKLAGR